MRPVSWRGQVSRAPPTNCRLAGLYVLRSRCWRPPGAGRARRPHRPECRSGSGTQRPSLAGQAGTTRHLTACGRARMGSARCCWERLPRPRPVEWDGLTDRNSSKNFSSSALNCATADDPPSSTTSEQAPHCVSVWARNGRVLARFFPKYRMVTTRRKNGTD